VTEPSNLVVVPECLDRVTVSTLDGEVVISWAERDALLDELRPLKEAATIVRAVEAVGTSAPVVLDPEQRWQALVALSFLRVREGLPPGLEVLYEALRREAGDR
jgi:hypothetical protein